jgi:hypothetical protein
LSNPKTFIKIDIIVERKPIPATTRQAHHWGEGNWPIPPFPSHSFHFHFSFQFILPGKNCQWGRGSEFLALAVGVPNFNDILGCTPMGWFINYSVHGTKRPTSHGFVGPSKIAGPAIALLGIDARDKVRLPF